MKALFALLLSLTLSACDYTVCLTPEPKTDVDPAWMGAWENRDEAGNPARLLLLPLGPREYLLSYPAGDKDAMFARVCRTGVGDPALMQLTWIGTAKGEVPEDKKVHQYAAAAIKEDKLVVRMLNPEVVADQEHAAGLIAAIAAEKDNPKLYREEMVFTRVPR